MAIEKRLIAVPPQLFIADGNSSGMGSIEVSDSTLFKVKQHVTVVAAGFPNLDLEIKRIDTATLIFVGPRTGSIDLRADLANYTIANTAFIYANEQGRPGVPEQTIPRSTFEEEPTLAVRSHLVDKLGNPYTVDSPFPVQLSDGSINIGPVNAELEIQLSHLDNDPNIGDIHDSVRIGDGTDVLAINPDGSINVVADITSGGSLTTNDGLSNGGVNGSLSLIAANTQYEAKVGISRLSNRKSLVITALDDMYWGFSNTVTVATGTPLFKNQQIVFAINPDSSTFQVWLVASGANKSARITESP
jgi:hypothetical protein